MQAILPKIPILLGTFRTERILCQGEFGRARTEHGTGGLTPTARQDRRADADRSPGRCVVGRPLRVLASSRANRSRIRKTGVVHAKAQRREGFQHAALVRGPWSVVRGPWSVVRGPWSVVRCQWHKSLSRGGKGGRTNTVRHGSCCSYPRRLSASGSGYVATDTRPSRTTVIPDARRREIQD